MIQRDWSFCQGMFEMVEVHRKVLQKRQSEVSLEK